MINVLHTFHIGWKTISGSLIISEAKTQQKRKKGSKNYKSISNEKSHQAHLLSPGTRSHSPISTRTDSK